jgi:hypothetical protein
LDGSRDTTIRLSPCIVQIVDMVTHFCHPMFGQEMQIEGDSFYGIFMTRCDIEDRFFMLPPTL